jgi:peptidyl-prolyl cis-trans isomerase SDCCAG10
MSQVYNLEPPTKGKVVLHTTHGDIEIELWPKEAPKVRVFIPTLARQYNSLAFCPCMSQMALSLG